MVKGLPSSPISCAATTSSGPQEWASQQTAAAPSYTPCQACSSSETTVVSKACLHLRASTQPCGQWHAAMSQTVQLTSPPLMEIPADSMAPVLPKELMAAASHPHSIIQSAPSSSTCRLSGQTAAAWTRLHMPGLIACCQGQNTGSLQASATAELPLSCQSGAWCLC